jgi:adhesin transport system membrane fusion protein
MISRVRPASSRDVATMMRDVVAAERLRPHGLAHVLLLAVAAFLVVFLIWASGAVLDEVTRAPGRVIPSRQIQIVQNLEGGIVAAILAREGQVVEEGEVLMRIENIRAASDYRERRARYLALLGSGARLRAEVAGVPLELPANLAQEAPLLAANEQALFEQRARRLADEVAILERQAEQRSQELLELRSRLARLERSLELARERLALNEPLARQRVVARADFLALQQQVNDLAGEVELARLAVPRVETALREAEQRIASARSVFRAEAQRELNVVEAELTGLREVVLAGEDRVRRTEVRSPVRGTVKQLRVNTIGGVVQPGADLVEIVPLDDTLLVEAQVRPPDIAFIRPGLRATVKITAYDFAIYGGLAGTVEDISADSIVNEKGESFYRVRVRTDEDSLPGRGARLPIIPGMTAEIDVLTGKRTVLHYLLKPLLRARERALTER